MRTITLIIVHCSATPEGKDFRLEDIDRWHRQRGWKGCGYHYVIELDGTVRRGRDESAIGAHCKSHNRHSIGVCYIGGTTADGQAADTRTEAQKTSLRTLLADLQRRYPHALVVGHHDLDPQKACPCYEVVRGAGCEL